MGPSYHIHGAWARTALVGPAYYILSRPLESWLSIICMMLAEGSCLFLWKIIWLHPWWGVKFNLTIYYVDIVTSLVLE